ncbi:MAG: hypothetical protein HOK54_09925 [Alphaproteobacteria bacterium]|nr:hypothetical protein [Alphaproteobacteria bacterium]
MLSLLCSTGIDLWFLYEEANLTEDVRVYKKCERCGKMTAIKERRTETREKKKAA